MPLNQGEEVRVNEVTSEAINGVTSKKEILYEGYFYDVTGWVKRHPGGKIIELYTQSGEDATLAIQQFHQRSTKRVMGIMSSLKKRQASSQALNEMGLETDVISRHKSLTNDFQVLYEELKGEGMFEASLLHVTYRLLELTILALFGVYLVFQESNLLKVFGIFSFAMFQGRSGWLMHEAGHHSLTGIPKVDRFIQAVVLGLGGGMASRWWSSQHNRHHAMPQHLKHDVDLQTLPLLAFNSKVVQNPKHGKSFFIQNQATLFLALDTFLVAIMWKIYLHPRYVLQRGNLHQLILMGLHYVFAYHIGFVPYVTSVWLTAIYLFGNFSLSHTHLPVTTGPLHWVEYALLHTMNIEDSWWCNWWMGYLNFQIEHHLFPTMPQFRNPLIAPRVRKLAEKHGIPYYCESYSKAVYMTFNNLEEVSKDLKAQ